MISYYDLLRRHHTLVSNAPLPTRALQWAQDNSTIQIQVPSGGYTEVPDQIFSSEYKD
jgi:hypothetical protein